MFLRGLNFRFAYLDDILFLSRSIEEHGKHLWAQLQRYGLRVNQAKCALRAPEVTLFGYNLSVEGSQPLEERVAHLEDCPPTKILIQLSSFLRLYNSIGNICPTLLVLRHQPINVLSDPSQRSSSHQLDARLHRAYEECYASL